MRIGDGQVRTLIQMGDAACKFDECIRGKMFYSQAFELVEDMDSPWSRALILEKLGSVAFRSGAIEEASENFNNSLKVFRAIGDQWRIVSALTELGKLALSDNRLSDAGEAFDEALNKAIDLDSDVRQIRIFVGIAGLYSLSGENLMAARLTNWLLTNDSVCVLANE